MNTVLAEPGHTVYICNLLLYSQLLVTVAMVEGSYHLSRGQGSSLSCMGTTSLECSVLECGQVYSTVRCVADNVFCSGSTSQRHDSKRTAAHAPKQCLPSARPKLSAANSSL
jgi:hypothetical protein